jgi:hypothetical protein
LRQAQHWLVQCRVEWTFTLSFSVNETQSLTK